MQEINRLIYENSKLFDLDEALVKAIILVESSMNPRVMRYEKKYRYIYEPGLFAVRNGITPETEIELQKFSYGLMQIMGAVARERGFQRMLPELLDPNENIRYGCIHLAEYKKKYPIMTDYISAYNQGSPRKDKNGLYLNQNYVKKVMNLYVKNQKGGYLS